MRTTGLVTSLSVQRGLRTRRGRACTLHQSLPPPPGLRRTRRQGAGQAARPVRATLALLALTLGLATSTRAATVPVSESFESYAAGYDITNAAGWSGIAGAGIVTNDAAIIAALTTYTNAGHAFPLPNATHEKVLRISEALTNSVHSATGGVVISEMLFMPAQRDAAPAGSTNYQFACYVDTNDLLAVWHRGASTNEWITLTNSPSMETGVWYRVAVRKAYASHRYQVAVNDGAAIMDDRAWSAASGGSHPGSWFDMVQTNGYMSRFRTEGDKPGYLDDMVFTNRSVSWSGTNFVEAAANDGSIATTQTISLAGDTFVNTTYSAGTHFSTSGVPAGLSAALTYVGPTTVNVTLTGNAAAHAADDGVSGMGVTLGNAMFTLGNAADVSGAARGGLTVTFDDAPVLSYAPLIFTEDSGNTGAVANTVSVTLTGDTFVATSPFVENTHYTVSGVPAGMTFGVTRDNPTNLTLSLDGAASAHGDANDTTLVFALRSEAFQQVAAANITGASTNLAVDFADAPTLGYGLTEFAETAANNGTVGGTTIVLAAKQFAGTAGTNYVAGGDVTVDHLPGGLTLSIVKNNDQQATLSFGGAATHHEGSNSIANLTIVFHDSAFQGGGAAAVIGYSNATLQVTFDDAPVLSYSPAGFTETNANNGAIGNAVVVTLTDETFAAAAFSAGTHYSTSGVPAGLSVSVTRDNATQATVRVSGNALAHANENDASMTLAFLNAAFVNVAAADIVNSTKLLAFDFNGQPSLAYSRTTFTELSGGAIDNTDPLAITLSGPDVFAAGALVEDTDYTVAGLPAGLTAVLSRISDTEVRMTLSGTATAHANANDTTFTNTFLSAAFGASDADQVTGYRQVFAVDFNDSVLTINPVPYRESFEEYGDGFALHGTNGWQSGAAAGAIVTGDTAIVSALTAAFSDFPLVTNHTKVLRMADETTDEIKSGSGGTVYSDMMFYVTPREEAPAGSTNYQFAMYVDTNQVLNVWHSDTSGTPTNTWATLSGVTVATGAWHRVTVEKDYANGKYRLYLDGVRAPVDNPTSGDAWFNMVSTANAYMSRVRVTGATATVPTYLDDLVVDDGPPAFLQAASGTLFKFR